MNTNCYPAALLAAALVCGSVVAQQHAPRRLADRFRDPCATIPPGAMPLPNGSAVRAWNGVMAEEAEADDFVIYKHEWFDGGITLGPYGSYHVDLIARRLPHVPFPVLIQTSGDPGLDQARHSLVVLILSGRGITDAPARVVVGFPAAEGLTGDEAVRLGAQIYRGRGGQGMFGNFGGPRGGFGGGLGGFGGGLGGFGIGGFIPGY